MQQTRLFNTKQKSYRERTKIEKDYKRYIFIACEGLVTEPNYFKKISDDLEKQSHSVVDVRVLDRHKNDGKSHPYHVLDGLIEHYKTHKKYFSKDDSLWIVIDIDQHFGVDEIKATKNYQKFLARLKKNMFKCEIRAAISNPSFELWLILHHKDVDSLDLEAIKTNKKTSKNTYVKKYLSNITRNKDFNYGPYIEIAIQRSKDKRLNQDQNMLLHEIGTTVFELIEDILR